jgi:uncharacterized protein
MPASRPRQLARRCGLTRPGRANAYAERLAISQWKAAALQPPSLRAICPWEGFTDAYRGWSHPGGIREVGFTRMWSLALRRVRQRYRLTRQPRAHPLRDDWWRALVPDLAKITVPALICGSFSDNNLHGRGSFRGWARPRVTFSARPRHL